MSQMLSEKQERVLTFIRGVIESTGQSPTLLEIGRQFGMRSPASVHKVLVILEREGRIKRTAHIARGIQIIEPAQNAT